MINQNQNRVAQTFKQLLIKNNTNAYRISKQTGIDKTYLSKLSSGAIAKPGKDKLIKIAKVLNVAPDSLLKVFSEPEIAIQELGLEGVNFPQPQVMTTPRQDWGAAPDGTVCYDRKTEINTIKQWIAVEGYRIVNLFGLGGIGKTTVAIEVAKQLESEFDYLFWRSLSNVSLIEIIIQDALRLLGTKPIEITISRQIGRLLYYLRTYRCLLVLDDVEAILAAGNSLQLYQNGHQLYGELFRQIAQSNHQSCLLLVGNEKPRDLAIWESASTLVSSLQLQGSESVCYEILKDKQLSESAAWDDLITAYRGHPLALKIVANIINELFNGNVGEFLRQNTLFLGDLQFILHQQYQRLSDIEQNILQVIAQTNKPQSLAELTTQFASQLRCSEIMGYLNSLKRRSLLEIIEINQTPFYHLQPVVQKYLQSQS